MAQMNMQDMLGLTPEQMDIARKQRYAEALRKQSDEPMQGQMVSGHYIAPSWTQGIAKLLTAYGANRMDKEATDEAKRYGEQQKTDFTNTAQKYVSALRGTPETQTPYQADNPFGENLGNLQTVNPAVAGSAQDAINVAMQSKSPLWQQFGMKQMMDQATPAKPVVVGRSLIDPRTHQVVATDSTWAAEQQAARQAKQEELQAKMEDARLSRHERLDAQKQLAQMNIDARRDIAAQSSADRKMIAGMVNAQRQQKNVPKLPTSALKLQQEDLDAIGTSSGIQSDIGALKNQIDSGQLKLGPVNNIISAGKNMAGLSDENSRNYASFRSTLEKLRNDSLRLNKGVQTEGDAQRAWNELIANINDPAVVSKRMGEIQKINERAANFHRMNIDNIRSNFGVDTLDSTGYTDQPAAVGTPAPTGKVKRYNPQTGRIE